jgi:hypothetical protein
MLIAYIISELAKLRFHFLLSPLHSCTAVPTERVIDPGWPGASSLGPRVGHAVAGPRAHTATRIRRPRTLFRAQ